MRRIAKQDRRRNSTAQRRIGRYEQPKSGRGSNGQRSEEHTPDSEDAVLLDTFAGSGSTLVAAEKEGFNSIGIEMNPEYVDIIRARLSHACKGE